MMNLWHRVQIQAFAMIDLFERQPHENRSICIFACESFKIATESDKNICMYANGVFQNEGPHDDGNESI